MVTDKKLTDKQRLFISEYMIDFNATQAAIKAGYSENTAQQIGSENLTKPLISSEIEKLINKELQENQEEKVKLLREYKEMAYVDLETELTKENPTMRAPDKLKAMQDYGKHLKLFTDVVQHTTIDDEGKATGIIVSLERAYDEAGKDSNI